MLRRSTRQNDALERFRGKVFALQYGKIAFRGLLKLNRRYFFITDCPRAVAGTEQFAVPGRNSHGTAAESARLHSDRTATMQRFPFLTALATP
jgi:hypothetical protein